jgi:opacity protein-like surface antigen
MGKRRSVRTTTMAGGMVIAMLGTMAGAGAAQAADGGWDGFHLGLDAARVRGDASTEATLGGQWNGYPGAAKVADTLDADPSMSGTGLGLRFGYDHTFAERWVIGVEADVRQPRGEAARTRTTTIPGSGENPTTQVRATSAVEIDREYSLRARLGYATPRTLWYVTAGYASSSASLRSEFEYTVQETASAFGKAGEASVSSNGLLWGVGVDWRFADHWQAGLRYTRASGDQGADYALRTVSRSGQFTVQPPEAFTERVRQSAEHDSLVLSLGYRF